MRLRAILLVAAFSAAGCITLSTLQTASVVPKGQTRISAAPEIFGVAGNGVTASAGDAGGSASGPTAAFTVPTVELGIRYGIADSTNSTTSA